MRTQWRQSASGGDSRGDVASMRIVERIRFR
jgi:hypothetical protein